MVRSRNLPLHRPVQVVQAGLKLGEVLLGALLTFDDIGILCWIVGPSGDTMIPKADRLQYVQANLPLHRPVQMV